MTRTGTANPLVACILKVRAEIKSLEDRKRTVGVRNEIMRRSLYLSGLEDAAALLLTDDDMAVLSIDLTA